MIYVQMPEPTIGIDIFALFIFLGVMQGLFLSYFFLTKKIRKKLSNIYLGLLMLALSLIILEIFLNYSGYILKIIRLNNFSEPLGFAVPPLFYLYLFSSIHQRNSKLWYLHLFPFFFFFVYSFLDFLQPIEYKQYAYYSVYYPELGIMQPPLKINQDPLFIRANINELISAQLALYSLYGLWVIRKIFRKRGLSFFSRNIKPLSWLRNFSFLILLLLVCLVSVKIIFVEDVGDFIIASFISIIIYVTSFNVLRSSDFFRESISETLYDKKKYEKSSLSDENKDEIMNRLAECMEKDKDYRNHLISLPVLAKKLSVSVHHISQVINEKMNKTFFEFIAIYRIREAEGLLLDPDSENLTIEDIADEVGYNSKSAFNRSFKKITGKTPSEYREQNRK